MWHILNQRVYDALNIYWYELGHEKKAFKTEISQQLWKLEKLRYVEGITFIEWY